MPEIVTVGEILVEIMRKEVDVAFDKSAEFVGPFPSGAPAIFTDSVARLGKSSGIIGAVGRDEFGDLVLSRLKEDGADVSRVRRVEELSTGVAFVTYFSDGSRKFLFHVGNSAAGMIDAEDIDENYVGDTSMIHISGSALTMSEGMREACYRAVRIACENDLLISLDPNVRVESMNTESMRKIMNPVLSKSDLLTPTSDEIKAITGVDDEEEAVERVLERGVKLAAIKMGRKGCRLYTKDEEVRARGFDVEVVDPTGAGDAFSAGLAVGWLEEMEPERLGIFANAVGAKAVTAKGPMEGIPWRKEVDNMLMKDPS